MNLSVLKATTVTIVFILLISGFNPARSQEIQPYEIDAKTAVLLTKEMDAGMTQYSLLLAQCYEQYSATNTYSKASIEMNDILVGRLTILANQLKIYYKGKRDKNNLALVDAIIMQIISSHNFIKKGKQTKKFVT